MNEPVRPSPTEQIRLLVLAAGAFVVIDASSQMLLAMAGWSAETPLQRLAGSQLAATQASIAALSLTLLAIGARITARPRRVQLGVVAGLCAAGLLCAWLGFGIPGQVNALLADVAFAEPERLIRGSRQAMVGWLACASWSLGMAWLLGRRRTPPAPAS